LEIDGKRHPNMPNFSINDAPLPTIFDMAADLVTGSTKLWFSLRGDKRCASISFPRSTNPPIANHTSKSIKIKSMALLSGFGSLRRRGFWVQEEPQPQQKFFTRM
jgi:hypothetical protein